MGLQTFEIPFDVPLFPARIISAGDLKCMYEKGNLRYISLGELEIVRMIYGAVRDENWETAAYEVMDEKIEEVEGGFVITYSATYQLNQIRYKANFTIEGKDNTINFSMKGVALHSFQTNRIGLCLHHPIKECAGKSVVIKQPDGSSYESLFPDKIIPHQPFLHVQQMDWHPADGVEAKLIFEGDVFETEDQRNWTDASYKTYSRPLALPFPFAVAKGDTMEQSITLKIISRSNASIGSLAPGSFPKDDLKSRFPKIGYYRLKGSRHLTQNEINLLIKVPFDVYRIELVMQGADWQEELLNACSEAKQLSTKLQLIVFFGDRYQGELQALLNSLQYEQDMVDSILVLHKFQKVTPKFLISYAYPKIKSRMPLVKVGYGTDAYFTELNRQRPTVPMFDFVGFSINPQVHAFDTRSLVETLEVQAHVISTTETFIDGREIHVSPVTLKKRGNPDATQASPKAVNQPDPRQHTWFSAYWTLQTLKNMSAAHTVIFFEALGEQGIILPIEKLPVTETSEEPVLTSVYKVLAEIKKFGAEWIIKKEREVQRDAFVLENQKGDRLVFQSSSANCRK